MKTAEEYFIGAEACEPGCDCGKKCKAIISVVRLAMAEARNAAIDEAIALAEEKAKSLDEHATMLSSIVVVASQYLVRATDSRDIADEIRALKKGVENENG